MLKVATWNVNSLRVRLAHIQDWLKTESPDILGLQETKLVDEDFPSEVFTDLGYQSLFSGQKTYNGVALLCKKQATLISKDFPNLADPQRRILFANVDGTPVLNLYVPNGSEVGSDKYSYKLEWLSHLRSYVKTQLDNNQQLIIMGDFNIAPEDMDVHDPEEWRDKVLVSEAERNEFFQLLDVGLVDCYRLFERNSKEFSWWDYRSASFRRNRGLRIDLILASASLAGHCKACYIDVTPRQLQRPSDHAPVVAEFEL